MPPKHSISELANAALFVMYYEYVHDTKSSWNTLYLNQRIGSMSSRNLLDNAIEKLKQSKMISTKMVTEGSLGADHSMEEITLTEDGINRANQLPSEMQIDIDELFNRYAAGEGVKSPFQPVVGTANITSGGSTVEATGTVSDPPSLDVSPSIPPQAGTAISGVTAGISVEAEVIPAADRFVTIDHNSAAYRDVEAKFTEFENILWRNDAPQDVVEKRDGINRDIQVLKAALKQGSVRARAVYEYAKPALIDGLKKIGDGFLKAVGAALFGAILKLLGLL